MYPFFFGKCVSQIFPWQTNAKILTHSKKHDFWKSNANIIMNFSGFNHDYREREKLWIHVKIISRPKQATLWNKAFTILIEYTLTLLLILT